MASHKIQLKLFADPTSNLPLDAFVPIFHGFIQGKKLENEVLIDVADYAHVHEGPGIVLIGHEADYYIDQAGGRLGLLFSRKRAGPAELGAATEDAFRRALAVCALLEKTSNSATSIRFGTEEALLRINDRLSAKNTKQTFSELSPSFETALRKVYGTGFELVQEGNERELFSVRVKAGQAPNTSTLLARLRA